MHRQRPKLRLTQILLATAGAALALGACSAFSRPPRAVLALDEAFEASRPALASRLHEAGAFGSGPARLFSRARQAPVALTESAGKAVDAARAEEKRSGRRVVLVASPLVARAILGGGVWSGDPALIVPEYRGMPAASIGRGIYTAVTDPVPAYAAAGQAAGAYVAELAKSGLSPSCGLLFSESPARPRAALSAFAASYAAASEGRSLVLRELPGSYFEGSGDAKAEPTSPESDAEAAVADILGSDVRILLIALGPGSGAALRKATRPGLAIGLDSTAPDSEARAAAKIAFRIAPDDGGLVQALDEERRSIDGRLSSAGPAGGAKAVPARLVTESEAASLFAGTKPLSRFLEDAALGAKGTDLSH
jgi:hypothetical protein